MKNDFSSSVSLVITYLLIFYVAIEASFYFSNCINLSFDSIVKWVLILKILFCFQLFWIKIKLDKVNNDIEINKAGIILVLFFNIPFNWLLSIVSIDIYNEIEKNEIISTGLFHLVIFILLPLILILFFTRKRNRKD